MDVPHSIGIAVGERLKIHRCLRAVFRSGIVRPHIVKGYTHGHGIVGTPYRVRRKTEYVRAVVWEPVFVAYAGAVLNIVLQRRIVL